MSTSMGLRRFLLPSAAVVATGWRVASYLAFFAVTSCSFFFFLNFK
jgi:hypothetical protein